MSFNNMIIQIDGKKVDKEPESGFVRVVEIPNKLKNFITKDGIARSLYGDEKPVMEYWTEKGNHHVMDFNDGAVYVNGEKV